jgi:hypothetical protein
MYVRSFKGVKVPTSLYRQNEGTCPEELCGWIVANTTDGTEK